MSKIDRSEEKIDWTGQKYIQHYEDGSEAGRSEIKTDWKGDKILVHRDRDGNENGRSVFTKSCMGDTVIEHRDRDGNENGRSVFTKSCMGDTVIEHRDRDGNDISRSTIKKNYLGKKIAETNYFDQENKTNESQYTSDTESDEPNETEHPSQTTVQTNKPNRRLCGFKSILRELELVNGWIANVGGKAGRVVRQSDDGSVAIITRHGGSLRCLTFDSQEAYEKYEEEVKWWETVAENISSQNA